MLDTVGVDGRTDLTQVAREVSQSIPKRGLVLIISDLLGVDNLLEGLRLLRQRGHDVGLFHVLHDDELDFAAFAVVSYPTFDQHFLIEMFAKVADAYLIQYQPPPILGNPSILQRSAGILKKLLAGKARVL